MHGIYFLKLSDILFWHSMIFYSGTLSGIYSYFLFCRSMCRSFLASSGIYSGILAWPSAVEVRQCPLRSGARSWGPAMHSRLRSGSAHWHQCPLTLAGGEKIKIDQETSRNFKHWETPLFNSSQQSKHHTLHGCFSSRQLLRSGAKLWSPEPLPETAALDQPGKCEVDIN